MIYFVRDTASGHVKIGFSRNPWKRFKNLQISAPAPLEMLAIIDGELADEAAAHCEFADLRIRSEWFRNEGILAERLATLPRPMSPRASWARPGRVTTSLHQWMQTEGLTDAALVEKLERVVSRSQINRIRRGRRTSPEVAMKLEEVTKIPAAVFVMGDAA